METCKKCGCSMYDPCVHPITGSCWWMEDDPEVCSHCVIHEGDPSVTRPNSYRGDLVIENEIELSHAKN